MRVIAGSAKGHRLKVPPGRAVRPTSDKIRGAVFDILYDVTGARTLDLFAGTGALGIEALSRGADFCLFVDQDRRALETVRENLRRTGLAARAEVRPADLARPFEPPPPAFDLILCDPPYGFLVEKRVLSWLAPLLGPEATAVVEHGARDELEEPPDLEMVDRRRWGSTAVSFFARRN